MITVKNKISLDYREPESNARRSKLTFPKIKRIEDLFLLCLGATIRVDVHVFGRLALAELIAIVLLFLYFGKVKKVLKAKESIIFFNLIFLWFFAIIISDIHNSTSLDFMMLGLARPIIISILFFLLFALLKDNPNSIVFFFIGLVLAGVQNLIIPTDFRAASLSDTDSYAFFAFVYTPLLIAGSAFLAWIIFPLGAIWAFGILCLTGMFSLVDFSRTTSSAFFIAAVFIVLGNKLGLKIENNLSKRVFLKRIVKIGLFSFVLITFLHIYVGLAVGGFMGERVQEKTISQTNRPSEYPLVNLFLTGRHYNISNYLMITENPVFGTGSWPLTGSYDYRAMLLIDSNISENFLNRMNTHRGTGHSIILGNWANYGPLALPFWIFILFCSIGLLRLTYTYKRRLFVFLSVFIIIFMFSIFFNNLNSLNRFFTALVPLLLILIRHEAEKDYITAEAETLHNPDTASQSVE